MRFPWQRPDPIPPCQVAEEFIRVLVDMYPEVQIGDYNEDTVEFDLPKSPDCAVMLHKVHAAILHDRHPNLKGRTKIYSEFIREIFETSFCAEPEEIGPADWNRILPRLVHEKFMAFAAERSEEINFPHRRFYDTGLYLVYVLDSERSVTYIADVQAQDLELDENGLYEKALENCRDSFARASLRDRYICNEGFNAEFCEDGHNSARLIILPEYMEQGEEIAVLLPDKDVFIATPVPPDNNWNPLRQVARKGNPAYIEQPMLVTPSGVRMM